MQRSSALDADAIIAGWRSGDESVLGADNPAGPLYAGGRVTERELTRLDVLAALYTKTTANTACSVCSTACHCL